MALAAWREVLRVLRGCRQLERSGWSVAWEALASAAGPTLLEILGRSAGGWPPSHHEGLEVSSFTLRMAGSARLWRPPCMEAAACSKTHGSGAAAARMAGMAGGRGPQRNCTAYGASKVKLGRFRARAALLAWRRETRQADFPSVSRDNCGLSIWAVVPSNRAHLC